MHTLICCVCKMGSKKKMVDSVFDSSYKKTLVALVNAYFEKSEWGCCLHYNTCSMVSRNEKAELSPSRFISTAGQKSSLFRNPWTFLKSQQNHPVGFHPAREELL